MKYQSSITKLLYELTFDQDRKKRYKCPECSHNRKKANQKDLEYYPESGRAFCFHCETTMFEYKPYEKKEFVIPERKNITKLTDKALKYFEGRMISQSTLNKMNVYSDKVYMPQFQNDVDVICFPYYKDGELTNIKYRGPKKSFKLNSGSELIFWNLDSLKKGNEIIICEGEMDLLSYIEIGYENVISVPNGANKNLEYLDEYIQLFESIERIYLSVDNDTKGLELRDELIRRLGVEKCLQVNLKECKDANEYFLKYSGIELANVIKHAKPIPVKGVIHIDNMYHDIVDLYENGIQAGLGINDPEIDKYITWELGKLAIGTGEPGMGKSELVDYIISKLNLLYGWKVGCFTPENYPLKYHYAKIYEKLVGKEFKKAGNSIEFDMAYEYIKQNYHYILNEDDLTIDSILISAKYLVRRYGIKILVIDPYNKIDHQYSRGQNETQYISQFLDKLTNFAKFNQVLVILIAHPSKLKAGEIPNLYSISGSANFYNKADYGFTFQRLRDMGTNVLTNESDVHWQKIRFKHLGKTGISELKYNYNNGRFENRNSDVMNWDNTNWLVNQVKHNSNNWMDEQQDLPY